MIIFDNHCDTLVRAAADGRDWLAGAAGCQWDLPRYLAAGGRWQVMAVCPPARLAGDAATAFALDHLGGYWNAAGASDRVVTVRNAADLDAAGDGRLGVILALEGASALQGGANLLEIFFRAGVRLVTLTWNHRNELADGVGAGDDYGLSEAGRETVAGLRARGMAVDVSHLNGAGFRDTLALLDSGVMASHSNARALCPHPRNLADGQVRALADRGGIVGFNFAADFIRQGAAPGKADFLAHLAHLRNVGGAGVLALGGDLDGIGPGLVTDARDYPRLLAWAGEILGGRELEGFAWRNARDFFRSALPAA